MPARHCWRSAQAFARAGADLISFHPDASAHVHRSIQAIKGKGVKAGLVFNPAEPLDVLEWTIDEIDLILIMSVNPGFGGQKYIPASSARIARLRAMLEAIGSSAELEVDGGVNTATIAEVVTAGASVLVVGSAIFNSQAPLTENVRRLRERVG